MPAQNLAHVEYIKQWRRDMGFTQKEAAERLGIARPYLSMLENGHREPSKTLLYLMDALLGAKW